MKSGHGIDPSVTPHTSCIKMSDIGMCGIL